MKVSTHHASIFWLPIQARAAQAPFEKRVEAAIQKMCLELKATMVASWSAYFSSDSSTIDAILARSYERMKNL